MSLLMLLLYPVISHTAIVIGQPLWSAVYLLVLIGFFLVKELLGRKYKAAFVLMILLVAGSGLVSGERLFLIMYLPPIVISLGLLLIFGRTLQAGRVPIITRYAELIDGELSDDMVLYTYRITQAWTLFFFILLVECIALAVFAPAAIWSLFTNVINYIAIAVMFFAEYIYRKRMFSDQPKRSFIQFMQRVVRIRPSELGV
jgi:uncharacterized membrane protein